MSIIERFKSYILRMHGVGINKHNARGGGTKKLSVSSECLLKHNYLVHFI